MSPEKQRTRSRHPNKVEIDVEFVEEIATCECSHSLKEHTSKGCAAADCGCDLERETVVVGEIEAIDEF